MKSDFEGVISSLKSNDPFLKKLDLSFNTINDQKIRILSEALSENDILKEVNLSSNQISDEGAVILAGFLKLNPKLEKLDLSNNQISDKGVREFSQALESNSNLNSINFGDNKITYKGFSYLFEALKQNSTLNSIGLASRAKSFFDFNPEEVSNQLTRSVADLLKSNSTLTFLDLSNNQISDSSLSFISSALRTNHSLLHLNLSHNKITDKGLQNFSKDLKLNNGLVSLDLRYNKISSQGLKHLKSALVENNSLHELFGVFDQAINHYLKLNYLIAIFNQSEIPQSILCRGFVFFNKSALEGYQIIRDKELVIPDYLANQLEKSFGIGKKSLDEKLISLNEVARLIKKSPYFLACSLEFLKDLQVQDIIKIEELESPELSSKLESGFTFNKNNSYPDTILFFANLNQEQLKTMSPEEFKEMKIFILEKLSNQQSAISETSLDITNPKSIILENNLFSQTTQKI